MKSDLLNDVLNGTASVPLFHYTDQRGLLGIVGNNEIWLTHTQYLNDKREFRHAVDLAVEEVASRLFAATGIEREVLSEMSRVLRDPIETINVCVFSLSERRDHLSQWRAYGGLCGAAVGFNSGRLQELATAEKFSVARCVYEPDQQSAIIRALIEEVVKENIERVGAGEILAPVDGRFSLGTRYLMPPGGNLANYLFRYAPVLKDPAFSEEQEWRVISRPLMSTLELFDFRQGQSSVTPYYRLSTNLGPGHPVFSEIIIGPTPEPILYRAAVKGFVAKQRLEMTCVNSSAIPYRNW